MDVVVLACPSGFGLVGTSCGVVAALVWLSLELLRTTTVDLFRVFRVSSWIVGLD
jgi:hypothetical protein